MCPECKQKLIESTKFKRKCENSNRVLHDLLQPGYDYNVDETCPKTEKDVAVVSKSVDFCCQTDGPESIEVIHKVDERSAEEIFEDGMQYYELKRKVEKLYPNMGDEFIDLCNQYVCFDGTVSFCTVSACEERISSVVVLQRHMRESHSTVLQEFIDKLEAAENDTTEVDLNEPQPGEQYTITENNEVIQVEEYEDDQFFQEMEVQNKPEEEEDDETITEIENVSYHCPICHKLYKGHDEIDKHHNLHTIVLPTLFESIDHYFCEICKAVFTSIDQVREHFSLGHETIDPLKRGIDREYGSLPSIPTKMFLFKEQTNEEITADGASEVLEIFESDCMEYDAPLICGVCRKSYNSVESIRYHTFSHLKTFKCPLADCEAEFDFAYKLLIHMRYTHFKEKTMDLTCPYCKEQFDSKKEYGVHLKENCSKRNIACHVCSKKFVNQAALKNHLKVHDQHKCEECDEVFVTNCK